MEIQYISDIHLEFMNANAYQEFIQTFKPSAKILVLAGDIGNPRLPLYEQFLQHVSGLFEKVFLIAGNHEFYGSSIEKNLSVIREVVSKLPNITFLDNTMEEYEGFCWIGTTLWSEITNPLYTINDTKVIEGLDISTYNAMHKKAKEYLSHALSLCKREGKQAIVITHHLPILDLVLPQFTTKQFAPYNQWFHANLNEIIEGHKDILKGWFYGHTHAESIQTHLSVPFYCFPKGYPGEKEMSHDFVRLATLKKNF
jgi:predicted phosphohydrolase